MRWTGADTASFSARAVAEWCAPLHLLEIRAVAGDTGVGIALYPPNTIEAGEVPDPAPRPGRHDAAAVGRACPQVVLADRGQGFQGDSGSLTLERRPDGSLGGDSTQARDRSSPAPDCTPRGSFDGLRVVPAPSDCAGLPPADTAKADASQPDTT